MNKDLAAQPYQEGAEPCVVLDPSLFTLPYDLAVCDALTRGGYKPLLLGRAQRPGERQSIDYLRPCFPDPLATLDYASKLRKTAKAFLYPLGWVSALRLMGPPGSVLNIQWMPFPTFDLVALSRLRSRHPILYTAHDTMLGNAAADVSSTAALLRRLDPDLVILHTEQGISRLLRSGFNEKKLYLVPHPPLSLPQKKSTDALPAKSDDVLQIAMIGEVKSYKGYDTAFKALAALPDRIAQRIRLRIAGRPFFDVEQLRNDILPPERRQMVRFELRYLTEDEFAGALDESTCILLPYREIEASGVLYTALARAQLIIASDVGAFGEILPHELLIPVGDHVALEKKLTSLVEDSAKWANVGHQLRQVAHEQHLHSNYDARLLTAFTMAKKHYRDRASGVR